MDYHSKYIKYKNRYLALKNKQKGGDDSMVVGINFEAGKIISWQTKCKNCVGWANLQIVMDAPYAGREAGEEIRKQGPAEEVFGYDREKFIQDIHRIFSFIMKKYPDTKIIIQIARGRSGIPMFTGTIQFVFNEINLTNYEVYYGYRTADYYDCRDSSEPYVFVNVGMFAVLTHVDDVKVGQICNPVKTWSIEKYSDDNFELKGEMVDWSSDEKNVLNESEFDDFKKIKLFGIADCMEFITSDVYKKEAVDKLIELANQQ
jgi:hypothetical protein